MLSYSNQLRSLIKDLKQAEKILSKFSSDHSETNFSVENFHLDLKESISKLEKRDTEVINELRIFFAPTGQWNLFVGDEILRQRIFEQLNRLK